MFGSKRVAKCLRTSCRVSSSTGRGKSFGSEGPVATLPPSCILNIKHSSTLLSTEDENVHELGGRTIAQAACVWSVESIFPVVSDNIGFENVHLINSLRQKWGISWHLLFIYLLHTNRCNVCSSDVLNYLCQWYSFGNHSVSRSWTSILMWCWMFLFLMNILCHIKVAEIPQRFYNQHVRPGCVEHSEWASIRRLMYTCVVHHLCPSAQSEARCWKVTQIMANMYSERIWTKKQQK